MTEPQERSEGHGVGPELGEVGSATQPLPGGLSAAQRLLKRTLDVVGASFGLLVAGWAVLPLAAAARRSTGAPGLFRQTRIGRGGCPFEIIKLRSMRVQGSVDTTVTTATDCRITTFGAFLRRTKLDELPQLLNVLRGEMSLVGPRPDVAQFVPLVGLQARTILSVRPGITGPATLVFRDEEVLLARQGNAEDYNVPKKALINEHYVRNWSLSRDIHYLWLTVRGGTLTEDEALGE